ncbi:MAG: type II 3-dehydroquinate dehydratase [Schleiferiaceae bacterium]|nr:type II 3-dehydroquinate dehydratase [Schleiferiaceae bacterium]
MKLYVLHGINLDQLGQRQPEIYGAQTLSDQLPIWEAWLEKSWPGNSIEALQFNDEDVLVRFMQEVDGHGVGFVLNPGAWTHQSLPIRDAVAGLTAPVMEVHLSHTYAREAFRRVSLLAPYTQGSLSGLGWLGYRFAMEALILRASH